MNDYICELNGCALGCILWHTNSHTMKVNVVVMVRYDFNLKSTAMSRKKNNCWWEVKDTFQNICLLKLFPRTTPGPALGPLFTAWSYYPPVLLKTEWESGTVETMIQYGHIFL